VRDTIARQFDVDNESMKYDKEPGEGRYRKGTITFAAKKGKSIDLQKLQKSLSATRLGKRTRSAVIYLEVTAEGKVAAAGKELRLEVSDSGEQFTLGEDPKEKPKEGMKTPYQRLKEALGKGEKVVSVTGRVEGWSGVWPKVLSKLAEEADKDKEKPAAKKPALLMVTGFKTVK
jgi:hypothetical protein